MYRCPTCVTIVADLTVRRCPVCNENFKRHPPKIVGADRRMSAGMSTGELKAHAEAARRDGRAR